MRSLHVRRFHQRIILADDPAGLDWSDLQAEVQGASTPEVIASRPIAGLLLNPHAGIAGHLAGTAAL